MKKSLLFSAFLCVLIGVAHTQTVSITANPSTTQLNGLGSTNYHVSEYIYTEAEIGASSFTTTATAIGRINLNAAAVGTPNFFNNVKIYLKQVPLTTTTLAAGTYDITGYTLVFSGTFNASYAGWVGIVLNTPFVRTSGNNLQMMIERTDNVDHSSATALFTWASANGNNTSATALTSRRYNGTAAFTATTALATSAFRVAVQFVAPVSVDAIIPAITPTSTAITCNSTNDFSVVLKNNGTTPIAAGAAAVTLRFGSPNSYSMTKNNVAVLAAGAIETIIFNSANVGNAGTTTDSAYVTLAGDLDRANDTIKSTFFTATTIRVGNGSPAVEGAETTLPVFGYLAQLAGATQLWRTSMAPPKYKNVDLTDSLGAHSGSTFYLFDSYSGTSSVGFVSRLYSNCISLPATVGNCTSNVSFWLSHDNSFATDLDSMYLSISTNKGVTWTRLAGYRRYGATYTVPTWVQETVSLTTYQGQVFQLGFEGVSKYGNVIGLDDITISSTCALPVSLASFKGERRGSFNNLEWTTASEANNSGFELQRSADGTNFSKLAFVPSKAATGNSSAALTYSFNDLKPFISNGYYRLKQMDKDGKATLSNIVLIKGNKVSVLTVSSIYPNPVVDNIKLIITAAAQQTITISIVDFTGKTITTKLQQAAAGDNTIQINTVTLATGSYLLKATNSLGETSIQKFIKQ